MTCEVEADTWASQQPWRATYARSNARARSISPFESKITSALCSWMAETWDCQQTSKTTGSPLTSRVTTLLFSWLSEITPGTDDETSTDGGDTVHPLPSFPRRRGKPFRASKSECGVPPGLSGSRRVPPGLTACKPHAASKSLPGGVERSGPKTVSHCEFSCASAQPDSGAGGNQNATWSLASALDPYLPGYHFMPAPVMPLSPQYAYPPQAFGWTWASYSYGAGFVAGVNAALPIDNGACAAGPGQLKEEPQAGSSDAGGKAVRSPHIRKTRETGEEKEQLMEFERSIGIVRDGPSKKTPSDIKVPSDKKSGMASRATTMMLRNIPNKYTQQMMLEELDRRGFERRYDFLYVPIDFRCRCNMGYAFMNFVTPEFADMFLTKFSGLKLGAPVRGSKKMCIVCPARIQGLSANVAAYRNSPVMGCPIEAYKPVILKDGELQPFPDPEVDIAPVVLRKSNV